MGSEEYEYITLPREKNMGFWIGMHYTMQQAQFDMPWDSTGSLKKSSGFNIQFMSGDVMRNRYWAAYGGLDWGMQFYGRTPNSNVVLNTMNEDSGYTRLRSSSMDFLIRGHWEYARYAISALYQPYGWPEDIYDRAKSGFIPGFERQ